MKNGFSVFPAVPRGRIELPTRGFSVHCSTNLPAPTGPKPAGARPSACARSAFRAGAGRSWPIRVACSRSATIPSVVTTSNDIDGVQAALVAAEVMGWIAVYLWGWTYLVVPVGVAVIMWRRKG